MFLIFGSIPSRNSEKCWVLHSIFQRDIKLPSYGQPPQLCSLLLLMGCRLIFSQKMLVFHWVRFWRPLGFYFILIIRRQYPSYQFLIQSTHIVNNINDDLAKIIEWSNILTDLDDSKTQARLFLKMSRVTIPSQSSISM